MQVIQQLKDTILLTQQSTIPLYMPWYNNLYGMTPIQQRIYLLDDTWYNNLYIMTLDTAISSNNLQQWFSKLSYALKILWYKTLIIYLYNKSMTWHSEYYPWTRRPPARCWRTPHRCAHQKRLGGRHATIQDYEFRVIILFFSVLPFVLLDIHYPKTHKPRGRASDVSTISTCFSLCYHLLPTPPPISLRTAGGITVVYLCGF